MKSSCAVRLICVVSLVCVAGSRVLSAEEPPANPLIGGEKGVYAYVSGALIAAAAKMPEVNYSFKPTPEVRSFGQLVGHAADGQYLFCSMALGVKNPMPSVEKSTTVKADLVEALKDAVAYCNKAYAGMTDAKAAEMIKLLGRDAPRLTALSLNTAHSDEHYGNMVTYLRLKGIVPPTSEPPK